MYVIQGSGHFPCEAPKPFYPWQQNRRHERFKIQNMKYDLRKLHTQSEYCCRVSYTQSTTGIDTNVQHVVQRPKVRIVHVRELDLDSKLESKLNAVPRECNQQSGPMATRGLKQSGRYLTPAWKTTLWFEENGSERFLSIDLQVTNLEDVH